MEVQPRTDKENIDYTMSLRVENLLLSGLIIVEYILLVNKKIENFLF